MYRSGDAHVLKGGALINAPEIQPHTTKTIRILTSKNQLKNQFGAVGGVVISFIDITGFSCKPTVDIMRYDTEKNLYKITAGNEIIFFTPNEYRVLKNLLKGLTAKQIAKQLSLSHRTIEDYINRIKFKLQCSSKHHIIEAAMRLGILQQNIIEVNTVNSC